MKRTDLPSSETTDESPIGGEARSIFDIIGADHRLVEDLFEQVEGAEGEDKIALIERCVQELIIHAVAEEETLYARLRDSEDLREDILEAEVEHALIERLAQEIMSSRPDDEMCDAKLMVMKRLFEQHVEEEEEDLLPAAQSILDADIAEILGEEMLARKATLEAESLEGQLEEDIDEEEIEEEEEEEEDEGDQPAR